MTKTFSAGSEKPVMMRIDEIVTEARDTRSFWLAGRMDAKPGQFVMAWLPCIGQKPFGVSYQEPGRFAMTVRKVGKFTDALFRLRKGDRLGVQGPYGRPFSGKGTRVALLGGGYGTAPMGFLADVMSRAGKTVFFLTGARTKDQLLFRDRFKHGKIHALFSTDDGSFGQRGLCTDALAGVLEKEKIDYLYCCGPEVMMIKVLEICAGQKIPAEFSLERYMKCGFGVCGSCSLDGTGWRVCKEGPVFTSAELRKITEFGRFKRDGSGKRVPL